MPKFEDYLGDFSFNPIYISNIPAQTEKIFLYHSKDDTTVPYSQAERLSKLLPSAKMLTFQDRGHFKQENFPELLENILQDS